MKCVYHKQDENYRTRQNGKLFYVQVKGQSQSSRENDPWEDIGTAKDSMAAAVAAMYSRVPLVNAKVQS